jgi:fatty-acyl-CoA synthase
MGEDGSTPSQPKSVSILQTLNATDPLDLLCDPELAVTHLCGVPANYQFMSALPHFEQAPLRPFLAAVGGSPVPGPLVGFWSSRGIPVMSVFGITEAGSTVITMPPDVVPSAATAVGVPVLHAECDIRDLSGQPLPTGEVGELWVRGPMLASGYWGRPEATREAITADGWLRTGDAALRDADGLVHIVDRWKDMYISGGENVYPAEIENVLYQHPAVAQAAVVGVPDPRWGEAGVAFVVRADGTSCDEDELKGWCRERLAAYKVPARIRFVTEMPRNATGKILKTALRQQG